MLFVPFLYHLQISVPSFSWRINDSRRLHRTSDPATRPGTWLLPVLGQEGQEGQGLDGLPETHVLRSATRTRTRTGRSQRRLERNDRIATRWLDGLQALYLLRSWLGCQGGLSTEPEDMVGALGDIIYIAICGFGLGSREVFQKLHFWRSRWSSRS